MWSLTSSRTTRAARSSILAVIGITGEWRHRTITGALLAAPDQVRFVAAKAVAYAGAGLVLSLAISSAVTIVGLAIVGVRGLPGPDAGELIDYIARSAGLADRRRLRRWTGCAHSQPGRGRRGGARGDLRTRADRAHDSGRGGSLRTVRRAPHGGEAASIRQRSGSTRWDCSTPSWRRSPCSGGPASPSQRAQSCCSGATWRARARAEALTRDDHGLDRRRRLPMRSAFRAQRRSTARAIWAVAAGSEQVLGNGPERLPERTTWTRSGRPAGASASAGGTGTAPTTTGSAERPVPARSRSPARAA